MATECSWLVRRLALLAAAAVEGNCGACHSLDYIVMNSPFLDAKAWTAEVTKMVNAFGAPIEKADQDKIAAYLSANYAQ
jgi:hypothetical protein